MADAWYCVYTHAGKEFVANAHLSSQGFAALVPVYLRQFVKRKPAYRPLFQNYLFVQFNMERDRWQSVAYTYGVRRILGPSAEAPLAVPNSFIDGMLRNRIYEESKPEYCVIHEGCRLRVTKGHFENKEGLCTMSSDNRVKLLLRVMQRDVEVALSREDVELVAA